MTDSAQEDACLLLESASRRSVGCCSPGALTEQGESAASSSASFASSSVCFLAEDGVQARRRSALRSRSPYQHHPARARLGALGVQRVRRGLDARRRRGAVACRISRAGASAAGGRHQGEAASAQENELHPLSPAIDRDWQIEERPRRPAAARPRAARARTARPGRPRAGAARPRRASGSWTSSCLNGFGKRPRPRYQP